MTKEEKINLIIDLLALLGLVSLKEDTQHSEEVHPAPDR